MQTQVQALGRGTVLTNAQVAELNATREYGEALQAATCALAHRNASLAYDRALDSLALFGRRNREQNTRLMFAGMGLSVTF